MQIIDRYMLRQFIQVFIICFCSLTGLYIVFDAFTNLDEFTKAADKEGNLLVVLGGFYTYRAIYFFDRTSGILALTASMFTVTWIQRHNELTALSAAGIANGRVIRPVIIAVMLIALGAAVNRELVIPRIAQELSRDPNNLTGANGRELMPDYDRETDVLFRGQQWYGNEKKITEPSFLLPEGLDVYGKGLSAAEAFYQPATADHPGGYLFRQVRQPAGIASRPSLSLGKQVILITPQDAKWLKPDECFLVSNFDFDQLTAGKRSRQFSSTWQLIRGLRNPSLDYGAGVRVTIHSRFVQPLLDTTLLLLGLPLILKRENRNVFLAIGMCVGLVTVFMLVVLCCQTLGSIYFLSPAMAAWLPLMIFTPCAALMIDPLLQ